MNGIRLQPMSEERYQQFMEANLSQYVRDRMAADFESLDEALAKAEAQRGSLLPQGQETPHHFFYDLMWGEEVVGGAWLSAGAGTVAYLYYVEISSQWRRKGFGAQSLAALEREAKQKGAKVFWLNVMGANLPAQALYRSRGFSVAAMHMNKQL